MQQLGQREHSGHDVVDLREVDLRDSSVAAAEVDFDTVYRATRDQLQSYCLRFLHDDAAAADVTQEALFRAWSRRESFESPAQVRPWLFRVARNLCIDTIRLRQRTTPSDMLPEQAAGDGADPTRPIEREEDRATVRAALEVLSPRHRDLLVRRDINGEGYEVLADEMGVSIEGVRAVVFRARRCLQQNYIAMREVAVA